MSEYTQIIVDKSVGIATVTLNRPDKLNAYTRVMQGEICAAMDDLDADDAVRAVIFTGAGERAFCAGADLTPEGGGHVFSDPTEVADLSDPTVRDGGGKLTLRLRSEEHTSELQSLMRISYAVFCLKKKTRYYVWILSTTPHIQIE